MVASQSTSSQGGEISVVWLLGWRQCVTIVRAPVCRFDRFASWKLDNWVALVDLNCYKRGLRMIKRTSECSRASWLDVGLAGRY